MSNGLPIEPRPSKPPGCGSRAGVSLWTQSSAWGKAIAGPGARSTGGLAGWRPRRNRPAKECRPGSRRDSPDLRAVLVGDRRGGGPHPGDQGAEAGRGPHLRPRMTLVMSRTTCAAGVRALTPSPGGASACACAASCLGSDSLPRSAGHAICRLRSYCFPCSSSILSTRPEKRPGDRRRDHLQEPRALVDHATGIQAPLTGGRVEIEIALSGSRCRMRAAP